MKRIAFALIFLLTESCGVPTTQREIAIGEILSVTPKNSAGIVPSQGTQIVFHSEGVNFAQGEWELLIHKKESQISIRKLARQCSGDLPSGDIIFCASDFDLSEVVLFEARRVGQKLSATGAFVGVNSLGLRRISVDLM